MFPHNTVRTSAFIFASANTHAGYIRWGLPFRNSIFAQIPRPLSALGRTPQKALMWYGSITLLEPLCGNTFNL